MNEKTIGYIMLFAGLLIMFGALIQVLLVFTGKVEPIGVFDLEAPKLQLGNFLPAISQAGSQSLEPIPTAAFNKILNMSTNLFLMGFVMSFGFKIASLGITLLRPIAIKVNSKTDPQV